MPADFGVSNLVLEAWDDFTAGLSTLSDGGARDARKRALRRDEATADVRLINIPGWDDFIHIGVRTQATKAEADAHYQAKRAGQASPLSPDQVSDLERRGRKARAIGQSAAPGYAQALGQVMVAIDNTQDLLSTVATVGRLVINPAIRVLDALGPAPTEQALRASHEQAAYRSLIGRRAAGEAVTLAVQRETLLAARTAGSAAFRAGAFKLGAYTIGRALPVLGWVLIAGDLLNLVRAVGMLASPFYALACGGPRAAASAGLVAALFGPTLCKPIGALSKINPFGRKSRLRRARTLRSWRPSFSNLIEAAQTTDALFGVGLSLGALVGTVTDSAFGAEQKLRGRDVRINLDGFTDANHRIFSGQLARETTAGLHDLRSAAGVLANGVTFHGVQEVFTLEEHMEFLVASDVALSVLERYIMSDEMEQAVELAMDHELEPTRYGEELVQSALELEGVPWPQERRWPLPGSPRTVRGEDLVKYGATVIPGALMELLAPIRNDPPAPFIGAVVDQIVNRSMIILTGADDAIQLEDGPLYQTMTSLALANRWPNVSDGEAVVADFFSRSEQFLARTGRRSLSADQLDTLAELSGLQLFRLLGPDAPLPENVF